jgi:lysophospholipase L1-like esterase
MREAEPGRFTRRTVDLLSRGDEATLVVFGDSISAGFAVGHGFDHFLREMLTAKYPQALIHMINSGVCGDTSLDGLDRLDWSVISYLPDLVTINFGINDMYWGIGLGEFKSNLVAVTERIIDGCQSEILLLSSEPLVTPHYCHEVQSYYGVVQDVAEEMDVGFVDVYRAWMRRVDCGVALESLILPGLDHPNEEGYRIIAEELMRFF